MKNITGWKINKINKRREKEEKKIEKNRKARYSFWGKDFLEDIKSFGKGKDGRRGGDDGRRGGDNGRRGLAPDRQNWWLCDGGTVFGPRKVADWRCWGRWRRHTWAQGVCRFIHGQSDKKIYYYKCQNNLFVVYCTYFRASTPSQAYMGTHTFVDIMKETPNKTYMGVDNIWAWRGHTTRIPPARIQVLKWFY